MHDIYFGNWATITYFICLESALPFVDVDAARRARGGGASEALEQAERVCRNETAAWFPCQNWWVAFYSFTLATFHSCLLSLVDIGL